MNQVLERDRTKFLGASEIADVLGMGKGSAYEVWARKTGNAPEKEVTDAMTRGLRVERLILEDVIEELGLGDPLLVETQAWLQHPKYPFIAATLDCVIPVREEIEEWKSVGFWAAKEWGSNGSLAIPQRHVMQSSYQTAIAWALELTFVPFVRFVPMETLKSKRLPYQYDPELGDLLIEAGVRFWNDHVLTGVPPAATGSSAEAEIIRKRFPRAVPEKVLQATPEMAALVLEARRAKTAEKEAKRLSNLVKAAMEDCEILLLPDGTQVTYKQRKGSPAWAKIARELSPPDELIAKHTPEVGPRVLSLGADEEEDE